MALYLSLTMFAAEHRLELCNPSHHGAIAKNELLCSAWATNIQSKVGRTILNGRGTKIYGRTMNESAITYNLRAWQTTMHLTGTLDIIAMFCNYLEMMETEHLIACGMTYRSPISSKGHMASFLCRAHARIRASV